MKTLLISAGHSNKDSGAVFGKVFEASLAVELRNIVLSKLRASTKYNVISDGTGSINEDLNAAIAKAKKSDIAIEFHFNASSNAAAKGVETIGLAKDKALCQAISQAIVGVTGDSVRGDKGYISQESSARGKLGFVNAGGVIVEVCFGSNPASMAKYNDTKWLVAQAIVDVLNRL